MILMGPFQLELFWDSQCHCYEETGRKAHVSSTELAQLIQAMVFQIKKS